MADSENEKSSSGGANNPGAGKDVLFGWLVGRAAADLGLAQALAASEAQRAEQFKRLEESLLAQIHQLGGQPSVVRSFDEPIPELEELKGHLQNFSERLNWLESAAQQATQMPELLNTEVAKVFAELRDHQNSLEMQQRSRNNELEASVGARLGELQRLIETKSQIVDDSSQKLEHIRQELGAIASRITRTELASQQAQMQATSEIERAQERVVSLVRSESAALKAELFARPDRPLLDSTVKRVEETFQQRLDDLHGELRQNVFAGFDAAVHALQTQMQSLTQRVEVLSSSAAPSVDLDHERLRWSKEIDECARARIQDLMDEIRNQVESKGESERFLAETTGLAHRITQNEQAAQQTATGLWAELSAIKAELSQRQTQQQTTEALVKSLEETVGKKTQEIQDHLVHGQSHLQNSEVQFSEFKTDLQRLAQRTAEIELMVHQTHALMANEKEQAAQQHEDYRTELVELRGQLSERQSMDAVIQTIDNLTVKVRELQTQVAQKMLAVDRRDAELRELKAQVQILTRGLTSPGTTSPSEREASLYSVDIGPFKLKSEDRLSVVSAKLESAPHQAQGLVENMEPRDDLLDGAKNQLTQLQERMSADIERARAELREKSGRWKVRR